jgi:hypothetical protein
MDPSVGVTLALIYLMGLWWLIQLFKRPDVLTRPGTVVLGMPTLRPRRGLTWALLSLVLLIAAIVLLFQGS